MKKDLEQRTKQYALRIINLYSSLPNNTLAQTIGKQILRSGTSVGANYREAARARSKAEFIAKLGIVEQELSETEYWLAILEEAEIVPVFRLSEICKETQELLAIMITSSKTARGASR